MKKLVFILIAILFPFVGFSQGKYRTHQVYHRNDPQRNKPTKQHLADWEEVKEVKDSEDSVPLRWKSKRDSLYSESLQEGKIYTPQIKRRPERAKPLIQPYADSADIANHVGIEIFPIYTCDSHPECRMDEMFLENISSEYIFKKGSDITAYPSPNALNINFNQIGWKTKRLGKTALDRDGNVLKGMRPVFIKIKEYNER